jgi:hypothetical protein
MPKKERLTLEQRVTALEKRMDEAADILNDDSERLPIRVRGIILDAMKPLPPLPPTKTLTIYRDNIKTRRPRKKG